jgi:linoleoyl-CoA desaturase
MSSDRYRFAEGSHHPFDRALRARVQAYFAATGKPRRTDAIGFAKAAALLALAAGAYVPVVGGLVPGGAMLPLALAGGLAAFLFALTVAHEAGHSAFTGRRRLDRLIGELGFALIGVSGRLWELRHVGSHHVFPNVLGADADLGNDSTVRILPGQPRRWWHRFQHLYGPPLYPLVGLQVVFWDDFRHFRRAWMGNRRVPAKALADHAAFAATKLGYAALMIVLPLLLIDLPAWQVLLGYLAVAGLQSSAFVLIIAGNHISERVTFPLADAGRRVPGSFAAHVLATTLDWRATSGLANFLSGGFNGHCAHHLFPTVSHRHYGPISAIIRATAAEYGVPYREATFTGMLAAHWRQLRALGRAGANPVDDGQCGRGQ